MPVVKSSKEVSCPYCLSVKVVRNGIKSSGAQNLLCKQCKKQFQSEYVYWACDKQRRDQVLKMLLRGSGIRDCSEVLGISRDAVLRCILRSGLSLEIRPLQKRYTRVQIDELWSYVGHKQKKVWMIYAYCAESAEILAFTLGKRSKRTVEYLMLRLKNVEVDFFLTDDWEAFAAVLPYEKHLIGKQFTKAIEGRNTWFRTRLRRLARRTVCFSKKLKYHFAMIKILIYHKKYQLSYI